MIQQHLLNQVIDIPQYPPVLILRQVVKQLSSRLVVHLKTLSPGICRNVHLMDVLLGEIAGGVVGRQGVLSVGQVGRVAQVVVY